MEAHNSFFDSGIKIGHGTYQKMELEKPKTNSFILSISRYTFPLFLLLQHIYVLLKNTPGKISFITPLEFRIFRSH